MTWSDRGERLAAEMAERLDRLPITDLAYTAGLFDGEACFTVEAPGTSSSGVRKAGRVRILVYMVTPDVLQWLHGTYGGCFHERKSRQANQRPVHYWGLSGKAAGVLLERLLPHLRVKGPQAEVAIAFYRAQMERPAGWRLEPGYVGRLHELKQEMLVLNRRGVA